MNEEQSKTLAVGMVRLLLGPECKSDAEAIDILKSITFSVEHIRALKRARRQLLRLIARRYLGTT